MSFTMSFSKKGKHSQKKSMTVEKRELMYPTMEENVQFIYKALGHTDDLKTREISWEEKQGIIIYLETIIDTEQFQRGFLSPLSSARNEQEIEELITSPLYNKTNDLDKVVVDLLGGNCALFLQDNKECFLFNSMQKSTQAPDEPDSEKVVRGSHKGFVDNLNVNLNMIRGRIKNRKLTIIYFTAGAESNTNIAMVYMNDIADPTTVDEVRKRIESISTDMVFSPGYIEECIEDAPFSPFRQILFTERPDRVEANLMEGRIAILGEGSADASIVPVTFFSFFQSPDDYNIRFYEGSFFRLLRLFSFIGVLTLPALYIAVVGFHFEVIPFDMIRIVKSSIDTIPFPPLIEALIMAITIELIREAGIRLPTPIGQTIGIVGGLIIGEAVVNAGLISNLMVIVIALTAIMSFGIPAYGMSNSVRILSLSVMFGAATLGFVGIVFALMIIIIHMCKLESFGTPYISPLAPFYMRDIRDAIVRYPIWLMDFRPKDVDAQKPLRQRNSRDWNKDG